MTDAPADESARGLRSDCLTEHGFGIANLVVVIGVCTAFGVPSELWGLVPGSRTGWAILGAIVTALAYGPYALSSPSEREQAGELALSYRAGYHTLNGLVVLLAMFVLLSAIGDAPAVHPETALQVTLGCAIVGYLAVLTALERSA